MQDPTYISSTTTAPQNFPTKYWHALPTGRVQCDLCPQECRLNEGQRGLCFVRMRENNQIVLTTYGRSSGFCIDPIEKKPLYHFLPVSSVLSFGTVGCNLACKFCQNWDISKAHEMDRVTNYASPAAIAAAAASAAKTAATDAAAPNEDADLNQCKSVAFTYNEPIIFMEYAIDTAKECHKLGIKTIAVTNGYICPEPRVEFFSHMDAASVGLKGFSEEFYKHITSATLQPVLDTLVYLKHQAKIWLEMNTLLIPGENDDEKTIEEEMLWIVDNLGVDVPLHFTAFHPDWKMLDKPATPLETLVRAREIAMQRHGLRYVYTGNVYYPEGNATYCHNCKRALIERSNFGIISYQLDGSGYCKFCGAKCAGVFG